MTSRPTVEVFVISHSDSTLAEIPPRPGLTPVDLRPFARQTGHRDLFAESAFLLADEAAESTADFVGLCSANYDLKWPEPPHLVDLPRAARRLEPSRAIGVELLNARDWIESAEHNHPGMKAIIERLASTFRLELGNHRVPGCNTFVCHRDEYLRFLDRFNQLLPAALDWYGLDLPFGYRCPTCGSTSDTGFGRWTRNRHVAYLGERITRLIFSSRPSVTFLPPQAYRRGRRMQALSNRVPANVKRRLARSKGARPVSAEEWHLSDHALEGRDQLAVCPVCSGTGQ